MKAIVESVVGPVMAKGKKYCADGCGLGCTRASFDKAVREAEAGCGTR